MEAWLEAAQAGLGLKTRGEPSRDASTEGVEVHSSGNGNGSEDAASKG